MYKQYLIEANNLEVFETEYGFFTYRVMQDTFQLHDVYIIPEARGNYSRYKILQEFFTPSNPREEAHIDIYLDEEWGKPRDMQAFLYSVGFSLKSIRQTEIIMTSTMNTFLENLWHR